MVIDMSDQATVTEQVLGHLHTVQEPLLGQDLISLQMVRNLQVDDDGRVQFTVILPTPAHPYRYQIQRGCEETLCQLPFVTDVSVTFVADVIDDRRIGGILDKSVRNTISPGA